MVEKIENADGSVKVILEHKVKDLETFFASSENLAEALTEGQLSTIASQVIQDYDADIGSRSEWQTRRGNWYKLFALSRSPKTFPWKDCSNVGIPTLSIAITQFQARAFEALFSQKDRVRARWRDGAHKDAALRVGRHMSYQLTNEMEEWEEDMDALLIQLPLNGSAFKKTYFDRQMKRPVSRYIDVEDLVIPYSARRLEDATRITHRLKYTKDQILKAGESKEYLIRRTPTVSTLTIPSHDPAITQEKDAVSGISPSGMDTEVPQLILEQHRYLDLDGDGIGEPYIVTVNYDDSQVYRIESRKYMTDAGEEKVFDNFTHYIFIPNPEGIYGFGFGHLLEGLNEAINSIINQLIDAGTLNNVSGGLYARRSGLTGGDIELIMGQFKGVDVNVDDIRKAIFQFQFKEPSGVLFELLGLLQEYAKQISTVSDQMIGKVPPSDTTATTMMAVLEQGLKMFSTIQRRIHRALSKELKKIFVINSVTLDEDAYFEVQDSASGEFASLKVGREDYSRAYDVVPTADPNITSKTERFLKARQAWEFAIGNPLLAEDREVLYQLTLEYLRALDIDGADKFVPRPQPTMPVDLSPDEENAGFLDEKAATVLPQQNHVEHLHTHRVFAESSWAEQLTPQGKKLLEAHVRATLAAAYLKEVGGGEGEGEDAGAGTMGEMAMSAGYGGGIEGTDGADAGNEAALLSMFGGGLPAG